MLARAAFWLAVVAVTARALWPDPFTEPMAPQWDKVMHASAFYVLSLGAGAAYPRTRLLALGAWLLALGGLIELLQAIPVFQRDASLGDLMADLAGILLAFVPGLLPGLRQALGRR